MGMIRVGIGYSQHAGQVVVCDGTPEADERIYFRGRVLTNDPMLGPRKSSATPMRV